MSRNLILLAAVCAILLVPSLAGAAAFQEGRLADCANSNV